jgi:hypothetical protein
MSTEMEELRIADARRWTRIYRRWAERAGDKHFPDGAPLRDYWLAKADIQEQTALRLEAAARED